MQIRPRFNIQVQIYCGFAVVLTNGKESYTHYHGRLGIR